MLADTTCHRVNGTLSASMEPGLGVTPIWNVLGNAVVDIK